LNPITTSTEAFSRDTFLSGALGSNASTRTPTCSSLFPAPKVHENPHGKDTFANTNQTKLSTIPVSTSVPRGPASVSVGLGRDPTNRPKNDSHHHAKKAKMDRMVMKEDWAR